MSVLPILTGANHPLLRAKNRTIPKVTKELLTLIKDMEETTKKADGLGLAAPQVGQSIRLCLVRLNGRLTPLINPEIFWKGDGVEIAEEGCLSLPNVWIDVPRAKSIAVRFLNAKGQEQERKLTNLEARIVQHEVDHLNGLLIVDYKENGK